MGPVQQYATEQPQAPYDIRIYPGADARFTMYEDDNETYAYEKGQRSTYDLMWNDGTKTLTIGGRQGTFLGMVRKRQLNVSLMGSAPLGDKPPTSAAKQVLYDGRRATVQFSNCR